MAPLGGPAAAVAAGMPLSASSIQTAMHSAQSVPASSPLEARCNLRGKTMAEYIFIGGTGGDLRSKTRVLDSIPAGPEDCPVLTFDGTLTRQAGCGAGSVSMLYLQPRAVYPDPFRAGNHVLVLCDVMTPPPVQDDGAAGTAAPHTSNNRAPAAAVLAAAASAQPTFSVEQQYLLLDPTNRWPLGWPAQQADSKDAAQKQWPPALAKPPEQSSYCDVGHTHVIGRQFSEAHMRACLHAGISITGAQAEPVPGQWSYSLGPCSGIDFADQLWMSRFILHRLAEHFQLVASLDPKPVPGAWPGSGAPISFSTRDTREPGKGWYAVQAHVRALAGAHMRHMMVYGAGNDRRLTGRDKTSSLMTFSWGLENRAASVSIPHSVLLERRGGYEDRRPAANMDPYLATMMLAATTGGITVPSAESHPEMSESEALSSAILDEMDVLEAFAPDTPPQGGPTASLATEASSDNFADAGADNFGNADASAPSHSAMQSNSAGNLGPQVHGGRHFEPAGSALGRTSSCA